MCCHARSWARAPRGSLLLKPCLFPLLVPSCCPGIAALWDTLTLRGTVALPDPPACLGRSTPPWTTTQRPQPLWAFSSQPPSW